MKQVPPGNFPMHHGRVEHDLANGAKPKPTSRREAAAALKLHGKDGAHLIAIFRPERGGIEVEKQSIEIHQVVLGATPHKRAILSKSRRRPASASATALPNGVMR